MCSDFIELIKEIESYARDLKADFHVYGNTDVESDLAKIIYASTLFSDQIVKLNLQASQNTTVNKMLNDSKIRHDLRTPLNAILGYSELLIEEENGIEFESFILKLSNIHDITLKLLSLIDNSHRKKNGN